MFCGGLLTAVVVEDPIGMLFWPITRLKVVSNVAVPVIVNVLVEEL
mgnify:CR=1 FL=1